MRKKAIGGIVSLVLGLVMVAVGFGGRSKLSADVVASEGTVQKISILLFVGVALIILSAILFIRASATEK